MKSKIILAILLICSIAINIYQYNNQTILAVNLQFKQTELNSLNEKSNSIDKEISDNEEEIAALLSTIENLENSIQLQQSENDSLSQQLKDVAVAVEEVEIQKEESKEKPKETIKETTKAVNQESDSTQSSESAPKTENNTESAPALTNPNTGEPLQPGDSGVTNGFEWEFIGDI